MDWQDIKHKLGFDLLDDDSRNIRVNICKTCEKLSNLKVCKVCNCFMPAKTWLKTKKCPIGKW